MGAGCACGRELEGKVRMDADAVQEVVQEAGATGESGDQESSIEEKLAKVQRRLKRVRVERRRCAKELGALAIEEGELERELRKLYSAGVGAGD